MSLTETSGEYIVAAGKASPPLAVTGLGVAGLPLEQWVLIATLFYTVLQTFMLVRKYWGERATARAARRGR